MSTATSPPHMGEVTTVEPLLTDTPNNRHLFITDISSGTYMYLRSTVQHSHIYNSWLFMDSLDIHEHIHTQKGGVLES